MRRGGQQLVTMESSDEDSGDPQEVWIVKSFHSFICEVLFLEYCIFVGTAGAVVVITVCGVSTPDKGPLAIFVVS